MSDQPFDDLNNASSSGDPTPPGDATPANREGWHTPGEEDAAASDAAPQDKPENAGSWYAPDETELAQEDQGWRAPEEVAQAGAQAAGEVPGGWYTPGPEEAAREEYEVTSEGGWHVPPGSQAADLLAGVDRTVYPQAPVDTAGPEQEPLLIDDSAEEDDLRLIDDSAEEDRLLVDDSEEFSDEAILGTDAERALYEQEAADVAAEMAARVSGEEEIAALDAESSMEDSFFPRAEDSAAIAEARAAELAAEAEEPPPPTITQTTGIDRLVSRFDNVEAQVGRLRAMHRDGQISRDALQAELKKLMILDDQGTWWMVGLESNTWYRFDNGQWVEAQRPRLSSGESAGIPAPGAADYLQETQENIVLDEYNMPYVQQPQIDPEATMVGQAATDFSRGAASDSTIPSPSAYGEGRYISAEEGQPDYDRAFSEGTESDLQRKAQEEQARRRTSTAVRVLVATLFGLLGLALITILAAVLFYSSRVNNYNDRIEALAEVASEFETTRIYDRNSNLLSQINDPTGGTRISVPLDQISPYLLHAIISTEDERFYENPGWDPFAIMRAAVQNLQSGTIVSGASTITQQLAKALVLEPERRTEVTYSRKLDEAIIAAEIGRRYTKNEILELYLNEIYFGNVSYGAEAAAQTYFDVGARDVNLPQSALLAGIVQSPATYDPITNRELAFDRMDGVLEKMVERGCIAFQHEPYLSQGPFCVGQSDVQSAVVQKAEVEIREYSLPSNTVRYPHFVNYVAQQLEENYGLSDIYRTGFNVFTTLDPGIQDLAQQVVTEEIARLNAQGRGGNNASVVVMDPRDGAILAMVGSAGYDNEQIDGQVNVAFTPQQPGSSIKPILYVAALQGNAQGQYWTPASVIWDTRTCWGGYCPVNYDGEYHGPQSMRSALANSYN
ncbi:MAG: penicillin-binding protein, partial [Anaerolineae bacterium]|nr:penicillin-binding protein [Anaerolineae bacterium]